MPPFKFEDCCRALDDRLKKVERERIKKFLAGNDYIKGLILMMDVNETLDKSIHMATDEIQKTDSRISFEIKHTEHVNSPTFYNNIQAFVKRARDDDDCRLYLVFSKSLEETTYNYIISPHCILVLESKVTILYPDDLGKVIIDNPLILKKVEKCCVITYKINELKTALIGGVNASAA